MQIRKARFPKTRFLGERQNNMGKFNLTNACYYNSNHLITNSVEQFRHCIMRLD